MTPLVILYPGLLIVWLLQSNDPGLLIDIYSMKPTSRYVIPGKTQSEFCLYQDKSANVVL